jgi:hypothetical protein
MSKENILKDIEYLVKTKSDIWSYEREIRIMFTNLKLDNQNKTLFNFDKSCISEIYLGNKILENDEIWIRNFCNKNLTNINLYRMFKPQNSFELIPKSID